MDPRFLMADHVSVIAKFAPRKSEVANFIVI